MKKNMLTIISILIILILMVLVWNKLTEKPEVIGTDVHIVGYGDTLWSIADERCPNNIDMGYYIQLMYELNEGLTPEIQIGQEIVVPIILEEKEIGVAFASEEAEIQPKITTKYTPLGVPNVHSTFKSWMDYRKVTNINSPQYKFIDQWGWADHDGFMRCDGELDLGIEDNYYLIALGSYYGTEIGTKYRITLDTGRVFYGVLAECKADIHTNITNQYVSHNTNIVEFLVDTKKLNNSVLNMGSANVYMPLNGKIAKIEKIDFILE